MAKGESEMSWYAEVILSYIIIDKQSDMERRHSSPYIFTSHSLFFRTFQSSYHRVPWGALGKKWCLWLEKKIKRPRGGKYIRLLGCLSRKSPVDGTLQARVHQLHHRSWSILVQGNKNTYLRNLWITTGGWDWSKKGAVFYFPLLSCSERLRQ